MARPSCAVVILALDSQHIFQGPAPPRPRNFRLQPPLGITYQEGLVFKGSAAPPPQWGRGEVSDSERFPIWGFL